MFLTDLYRKGLVIANNTMDVIDDLKYQYPSYSNRLEAVHDMSDRDEGFKDGLNAINNINDYLYDSNGNMISDQNKEISLITYNHLNLPERIEMTQGVIEYFYTATGIKQKKRVTFPNNDFSETLYAGGFVYSQTQATTLLHDFDFYFTPEGYAKKENGLLSYVYQYKDHLGNIRLSFQKDSNNNLVIIEENNYYPFGLKHDGYNAVSSTSIAEKYKYNGKEWQDELGLKMYDMDMRQYDPAIARWVVIDPVVHHDFSPYNAFDNNPVFWADPSGADATSGFLKLVGTYAQNAFRSLQSAFMGNPQEGEDGDDENKGDDENDPRKIAYSLHVNGTQVLPPKEYEFEDFLNSFLYGETSRFINIGGQDFQVDNEGKIAYENFLIKLQFAEEVTFFIAGGGPAIFKFASDAKGFVHYAKHVKNLKYLWNSKQWKSISNAGSLAGEISSFSQYQKAASTFFNIRSSNILQYVNKQGTIFRYNMKTGHFGIADTKGIIQTFYKLDLNKGMNYFIEQVIKY